MGTAVAVGLVGLMMGFVVARPMSARLTTLAHRYDEESGVRVRSFRWVQVAIPAAAALVGAAQTHVGGVLQGVVYAALTVPLVVLAAIDLDVHRLPDRWTGPTFGAALVGVLVLSAVRGQWHSLVVAVLCGCVIGAFFLTVAVIAGGQGFGLGDVKLSPTLGLMLGFNGAVQALLGLFAGFLSGAVLGVILMIFTSAGRKTAISFGPHLVLGALVVLALPLVGGFS